MDITHQGLPALLIAASAPLLRDAVEEGILQDEGAVVGEEDDAIVRTAYLLEDAAVVGMVDAGQDVACLDGVACLAFADVDAGMVGRDGEEVVLVEQR